MQNKFLRKLGIMVMCGTMVAQPVISAIAAPVTVYAEELGDVNEGTDITVGAGDTATSIGADVSVSQNNGDIGTNNGTVDVNAKNIETNSETGVVNDNTISGTVFTNYGQVVTNSGEIFTNSGAVNENLGTVDVNVGGEGCEESEIGVIGVNNLKVDENNGYIINNGEFGTVVENNGNIFINNGVVETNNINGNDAEEEGITENNGIVDVNNGVIDSNYGYVGDNTNGIITNNFGSVGDCENPETIGTIINQWWRLTIDSIKDLFVFGKDSRDDVQYIQTEGFDTDDEEDDVYDYFVLEHKSAVVVAIGDEKVAVPNITEEEMMNLMRDGYLTWNNDDMCWEITDVDKDIEALFNVEDVASLTDIDKEKGVILNEAYGCHAFFDLKSEGNPLKESGTWASMAGIADKDFHVSYVYSGMTILLGSSYDEETGEINELPVFNFYDNDGNLVKDLGDKRGLQVIATYNRMYNRINYRPSIIVPEAPSGYAWKCEKTADGSYKFSPAKLPECPSETPSTPAEETSSTETTPVQQYNFYEEASRQIQVIFDAQAIEGSTMYEAKQIEVVASIDNALARLETLTGEDLENVQKNGINLAVGGCKTLNATATQSLIKAISKAPVSITMSIGGQFVNIKIPKGFDVTKFLRADGSIDLVSLYNVFVSMGLAK